MSELPAIGDILVALFVLAALFAARFVLAVRRVRGSFSPAVLREAVRRVRLPNGFGPDREPERRHALRQFSFAASALVVLVVVALFGLAAAAGPLLLSEGTF